MDTSDETLSMVAYIDITGDRISPDDPRGFSILDSDDDQHDLSITIVDPTESNK